MSVFAQDKTHSSHLRIPLILFIEVIFVKLAPFKIQLLEAANNEAIKIT